MASYPNVNLSRVYASQSSQNCWAFIPGKGWVKVSTAAVDATTNIALALTAARANNKTVTVYTNAADDRIVSVYL